MPNGNSGCVWTNNNLACLHVWSWLRFLKQFKWSFKTAGDHCLNEMTYWNKVVSDDLRAIEAKTIAAELDRIFTQGLLAAYESGFNMTKAVNRMTEELADGTKTVCEFSMVVDEIYQFT